MQTGDWSQRCLAAPIDELMRLMAPYVVVERAVDRLPTRKARLSAVRRYSGHTRDQWLRLKAEFDHRCVRCGCSPTVLTRDHILPLCKGGSDDIGNIQPLCGSCNSSRRFERIDWAGYRRDFGFAEAA